jgi:antitoxin component YwqK of YwqJK toxin-antitoxin module
MNQRDADGKHHGPWIFYWNDGTLRCKGIWLHGKRHGPYEEYRGQNELWFKGEYENDKKCGFWITYGLNYVLQYKEFFL